MYSKILIPVDMAHTEKASEMIKIASALSGKNAEFLLVNIVHSIPVAAEIALSTEVFETAEKDAANTLSNIAADAGIDATVIVRVGHASQEILAIADEHSADLIIVGSHRPGFQDYLIGSTASRVVRHANCPVFILR